MDQVYPVDLSGSDSKISRFMRMLCCYIFCDKCIHIGTHLQTGADSTKTPVFLFLVASVSHPIMFAYVISRKRIKIQRRESKKKLSK